MLRIGIDCRLPFYRQGGISQYVLQLLPALAEVDSENAYIAFHSRKDERSYLPENHQNFERRNLWTPCHHRWEKWTLAAEIMTSRLDVLHSPDFIPPAGGARRRIVTVHDLNFVHYPQFLTDESRRYYLDQIHWAVHSADHISADSDATRQDVIELLDVAPTKVTTIHLAANPLFHSSPEPGKIEDTLRRYGLESGYLLAVGTLEPRKNLEMLIKVFARLRRETAFDKLLVLVGSKGWLFKQIFETIAELNLVGMVRHLEGVSNRDLASLYAAAGLLATPSHFEGFGLPALEAQHIGCPVLVSNRGSLPEIVGPEGRTLDADDEHVWFTAIEQVLSEADLRSQMVAAGYRQARQFSWQRTALETLKIYRAHE